jgi:hypothetical protein
VGENRWQGLSLQFVALLAEEIQATDPNQWQRNGGITRKRVSPRDRPARP